jgi:hypothetical protein
MPVGQKPSSYDIPSMIVIVRRSTWYNWHALYANRLTLFFAIFWGAQYTLVIILGVGLCFCLRKANRLVPNRYSFPLILRGGGGGEESNRRRGQQNQFTTIDDEESRQGLLNDFSDQEDSDGEHEQGMKDG